MTTTEKSLRESAAESLRYELLSEMGLPHTTANIDAAGLRDAHLTVPMSRIESILRSF